MSKPQVLIVDDEPMVRQTLLRTFQGAGFGCQSAANGRDAYRMACGDDLSLVVTDLRMPVANGHQLAVQLLDLANPPPIIVLTGVMEPRLVNDLLRRGVDAVMFKPVNLDEVIETGRRILENKASAKSNKKQAESIEVEDGGMGSGEPDRQSTLGKPVAVSTTVAEQRPEPRASSDRDLSEAYVVQSRRILMRCAIALADLRRSLESMPPSGISSALIVLLIGVLVGTIVTCFVSWWQLAR